jgi:hypothetical protein
VFGDSNLIVHQIRGDSQCLDGVLNSYRDICLDIIKVFDTFSIKHIPQEENSRANRLAQQASGYVVSQGVFWVASRVATQVELWVARSGTTRVVAQVRFWVATRVRNRAQSRVRIRVSARERNRVRSYLTG